MAEKKNLVEDALLQMKNLEEAVAENAKGILAATMGKEISELVKESLTEQTDDEAELDVDMDMNMDDDEESSDMEMDMDTDNDDVEMDMDMDMTDDMSGMDDMDDETVDLTNASDEEILKVFKAMGEDDGIIVKKDNRSINLKDENEDVEYDIHLGESDDMDTSYEEEDEMWGPYESMYKEESDSEEMMSEEDDSEMMDEEDDSEMMDEEESDSEEMMSEEDDSEMMDEEDDEEEEIVYEIEMSDDDEESEEETEGYSEGYSEGMMDEDDEMMSQEDESYDYKKSMKAETKESKMAIKPKGVGMGKAKFSYKSQKGGFKEDMKKGNPTMGTGKAKFEYKEGKKSETKEAARTLGNGKKWGRNGLDKPRTSPRHIQMESVKAENLRNQVETLRDKNEEYRKALNIFRQKLNEVAVFNSNLAYATRLFTEHSTSKQEKINILRRFDGVESIKESKNL
jgi:hypothetical protein